MKRIMITGANSYIGTSFERYIGAGYPDAYTVDTLDMLDGSWRERSLEGYDTVLHVAGLAHQRETAENAHLYDEVNRDLALAVAEKAKADGVGQFILLSSMSVYGRDTGVITRDTEPAPRSHYGRSKWEAEQAIAPLADEGFRVCILRPPMVYGPGCRGNFNTVCSLVRRSPVFPRLRNRRSMIYVDNLSSFIKLCVDEGLSGVYFPQNRDYVCTMDMARGIAAAMNKTLWLDPLTGLAVRLLRPLWPTAAKAFGSLIYRDTEDFDFSYVVTENQQSFLDSVRKGKGDV